MEGLLTCTFDILENIVFISVVLADGLTNVVFKKQKAHNAAGPKSTKETYFFRMQFHLVNLIWVGAIQYTEIVFVYKSIHPKIRLGNKKYFLP